MEIIKFLIVGADRGYGEAICKCARNVDANISFSYTDNLKDDFSKYSMIIFDGYKNEKEYRGKIPCCYLTEDANRESKIPKRENNKEDRPKRNGNRRIFVYKFKKLSLVLTDFMDIYTYFTGRTMGSIFSTSNSCKIYSVTSSMGGVGATSIAMGLAEDMAYAGGNRTLYLSLGEYHQELNFAKGTNGKNLREYLYDLFYGNRAYCGNIFSYLTSLKDNLYMFNVTEGRSQFSSIGDKQFLDFINYLVEKNFFERIVVDIGTNIKEKWNGVYKQASCNILINNLMDSWYQEQFWMDFYKKTGKINERTLMVENHSINEIIDPSYEKEILKSESIEESKQKSVTGQIAGYFSNFNSTLGNIGKSENLEEKTPLPVVGTRKKKKTKVRILEDKEAFRRNDGFVDINLDSQFGQGIREIVMALADRNKIN